MDNFIYKGTVALDLIVAGKTINLFTQHNAGLPYLQKSFCKFLTGYHEPVVDIPRGIDLRRKKSDETEYKSFLVKNILVSPEYPTYDSATGNWRATFTASINSADMIDIVSEADESSFRLYLYSGILDDGKPEHLLNNDMAYTTISAATLARIVPGTTAVVKWSMQLTNDKED